MTAAAPHEATDHPGRNQPDTHYVSRRTILNWIETDKVPYLKLPGGDYRVPLAGLLASISGTYRLDEEIRALGERFASVSDQDVQAALADL